MSDKTQPKYAVFKKEMKDTHTILLPDMLPIHFEIIKHVFIESGYNAVSLTNKGPQIAQLGLKYVHNDTCYPALLVIGQFIEALQSGKYDIDHTALIITQTGGGCRASNYIHLLRKALIKAGFSQVPVISLNFSGLEKSSEFKMTLPMIRKALAALAYGDELMLLSNQARPYEINKGQTETLLNKCVIKISDIFKRGKGYSVKQMRKVMDWIAVEFDKIPLKKDKKTKVGIVGEIYVKYSALGNNELEAFLQSQDCEYMIPGVMGFAMYCMSNAIQDIDLYGGSKVKRALYEAVMSYLTKIESIQIQAVSQTKFLPPGAFNHTRSLIKGVVSPGCKMGEGWLLTAEMLELIEQGYPNIVCAQPFGCLPNHIIGRGMVNKIKQTAPEANIVAIDYDPSAAKVNQENRIKLMLASAKQADKASIESPRTVEDTEKIKIPIKLKGREKTGDKQSVKAT